VVNNPEDPAAGVRKVRFQGRSSSSRKISGKILPNNFFRLAPGREVRLRCAYYITCKSVVKDASGAVKEIHCTYDPLTRGGDSPDGRKVKSTLHWVSCAHAIQAEVRLYDTLFIQRDVNDVEEGKDFTSLLNPARWKYSSLALLSRA